MGKALVLHSGGMDSSVCLAMAVENHDEVKSISFDYGQRHHKEMEYADSIVQHYALQHPTKVIEREVHRVEPPPSSMLTDPNTEVPDIAYEDISGISPTYVPFRNGYLLSAIAGIAQAEEYDVIYFGAHSEDAENWAYPDCTPEFIGAMANAIYIGTYFKVRLATPLMWDMKMDIVKKGYHLAVPFDLTWSCYKGEAQHCGTCPTCISRREAFIEAGVPDPTIYAN